MRDNSFTKEQTRDLAQALRERRQRLAASMQDVSRVINVDWTTYRRWEKGLSGCCSRHAEKIRRFLAGEYDEILSKGYRDIGETLEEQEFTECLREAVAVYQTISDNPGTLEKYKSSLEEAINDAANVLLSK